MLSIIPLNTPRFHPHSHTHADTGTLAQTLPSPPQKIKQRQRRKAFGNAVPAEGSAWLCTAGTADRLNAAGPFPCGLSELVLQHDG